jgi:hypothetical protein
MKAAFIINLNAFTDTALIKPETKTQITQTQIQVKYVEVYVVRVV